MAKIGLCACYNNHNFGSVLQAQATCEALEVLGADYEIIRYQKKLSASRVIQLASKAFARDAWVGLRADLLWKRYLRHHAEIANRIAQRDACFERYVNEVFTQLSPWASGYKDLCDFSRRYKAVMVGSDQLWLPSGFSSRFYTLEFCAPGVKRLSYATSFGVERLSNRDIKRAGAFLKNIDCIGVREESGASLVRKAIEGNRVEVVVDPTLLFDEAGWRRICGLGQSLEEPYILCYFLGVSHSAREAALRLKKLTGYPVVMLRDWGYHLQIDDELADLSPYDVDPADFVKLISNARYVLTDSFHGTVFSLIHHKQFASFYRDKDGANSRNTRLDSLFSQLGTGSDRLQMKDIESIFEDIDYSKIDSNLSELRERSWDFLERAVNGL